MIRIGKPAKLLKESLLWAIGPNSGQAILDIGTPERFHKELREFEYLFAEHHYHAAGFNPKIDGSVYSANSHQDIEQMDFSDGQFDAVICLEVLEHCKHPQQAVNEIYRVLKPSGRVLITTPFLYGYHGKGSADHSHNHYPDFWRFTHEGLLQLFAKFSNITIIPVHGPLETRLCMLGLFQLTNTQPFRYVIDFLDNPQLEKLCSRFMVRLEKLP